MTHTHAVWVIDDAGRIRTRFVIASTGKTSTRLVKRLAKLGKAGVAIDRRDAPLVWALLGQGLRPVLITPRQLGHLHSRHTVCGA